MKKGFFNSKLILQGFLFNDLIVFLLNFIKSSLLKFYSVLHILNILILNLKPPFQYIKKIPFFYLVVSPRTPSWLVCTLVVCQIQTDSSRMPSRITWTPTYLRLSTFLDGPLLCENPDVPSSSAASVPRPVPASAG